MLKILLINSIVIFLGAYFFDGVNVKSFFSAIGVAIILGLINTFIKPLIVLLTLPLTVLTLGLFILVINGLILLFIGKLLDGFSVKGFWWAVFFSIYISVANAVMFRLF